MKKIVTILATVGIAQFAFAQGTINFYNVSQSLGTYTNTGVSSYAGGSSAIVTSGLAQGTTGTAAFYYTLLFDTSTPTSGNPLTGGWTQVTTSASGNPGISGSAPLTANSAAAGTWQGPNGASATTTGNWNSLGSYEIVGWSANLGNNWATVSGELADSWGNIAGYSASNNYFFGVSAIGTGTPGGGVNPSLILQGTGTGQIPGTFVLSEVAPIASPEPATMALAGLGGLALLGLRRKK